MKTIDFSYFIERYIAGEMSDTEKEWFLKELEGNIELRNEVDLRKRTDEVLRKQDVLSLRNKLSQIEQNRKEVTKQVASPGGSFIRYAAVIAALVLIGSITMLTRKNISNDEILNRYYKVYEPPTSHRSAQSAPDADFTLALELYNTHDYGKAAILFNKVLENKPNDMQVVLLQGVSNFEEKNYPEAKQSFDKVIENRDNLYVDQAQWYLALCYLQTNESEKAKKLFKQIGAVNGIYRDDAIKIYKGLK
jgi:tetratricopeptide (TPR) repeat protein